MWAASQSKTSLIKFPENVQEREYFPFQQMSPELILEVRPFLFPDVYLTGSRYSHGACHKISLFFNACQETSKQYWIVMDAFVGHTQGTISSRCRRHHSDPVGYSCWNACEASFTKFCFNSGHTPCFVITRLLSRQCRAMAHTNHSVLWSLCSKQFPSSDIQNICLLPRALRLGMVFECGLTKFLAKLPRQSSLVRLHNIFLRAFLTSFSFREKRFYLFTDDPQDPLYEKYKAIIPLLSYYMTPERQKLFLVNHAKELAWYKCLKDTGNEAMLQEVRISTQAFTDILTPEDTRKWRKRSSFDVFWERSVSLASIFQGL